MDYDVFISYASPDAKVADALWSLLSNEQRLRVWKDARELRAGECLDEEIERAIDRSRYVIVVASNAALNSDWVAKEVRHALGGAGLGLSSDSGGKNPGEGSEGTRGGKATRKVVPILLDGMQPDALRAWFDTEPLAITLRWRPGALDELRPQLLAALGRRAPSGAARAEAVAARPLVELVFELMNLTLREENGVRRATAQRAVLQCRWFDGRDSVVSPPFEFTAPLGPIEADELAWYLERYWRWPVGVFRGRAARLEQLLPRWGQQLHQAVFGRPAGRAALERVAAHSA